MVRMSESELSELWDRWEAGGSQRSIARTEMAKPAIDFVLLLMRRIVPWVYVSHAYRHLCVRDQLHVEPVVVAFDGVATDAARVPGERERSPTDAPTVASQKLGKTKVGRLMSQNG
jgi:hypothetical protein